MMHPVRQHHRQNVSWLDQSGVGQGSNTDSPSPLTKWIEEFQFLDGLKAPLHVRYYDAKRDPNNFVHAFKGAMRMEKWAIPVTCQMFVYILKDTARVWWNGLPKGVVKYYEDLKRRFRTHFKQQKKQTKTYLAIDIKRREGESIQAFITQYTEKTAQITRLNEDQRIAGFIHGVKITSQVKFMSTKLPESYDGLMEKVYSWLQVEETASKGKLITFMDRNVGEKPLKGRPWEGFRKKSKERWDNHDTNACKELKIQIEEVVKSGKLAHLVKGIRKGKAKPTKLSLENRQCPSCHADIFAWEYSDMTGIPRTLKIGSKIFVTKHKLNENKKITLVQQKKRGMAPERSAAASKEVEEL
ncbi:reverse transcriptase domain-containing protein, partial [Tanacetum coccineum]